MLQLRNRTPLIPILYGIEPPFQTNCIMGSLGKRAVDLRLKGFLVDACTQISTYSTKGRSGITSTAVNGFNTQITTLLIFVFPDNWLSIHVVNRFNSIKNGYLKSNLHELAPMPSVSKGNQCRINSDSHDSSKSKLHKAALKSQYIIRFEKLSSVPTVCNSNR